MIDFLTPRTFEERIMDMLSLGIPIFPLKPGTKEGFYYKETPDGCNNATTDLATIQRWIKKFPKANYGLAGRPDGFWFLDIDDLSVKDRVESETGQKLPRTFIARSGSGRGLHYYFRHSPQSIAMGNRKLLGEEADGSPELFSARCENQYVVGPGSIHPSGNAYEVIDSAPIIEAPDWLVDWIVDATNSQKRKIKTEGLPRTSTGLIPVGQIYYYMLKEAGRLRHQGLTGDEIEPILKRLVYENCVEPDEGFDDEKIHAMAVWSEALDEGEEFLPVNKNVISFARYESNPSKHPNVRAVYLNNVMIYEHGVATAPKECTGGGVAPSVFPYSAAEAANAAAGFGFVRPQLSELVYYGLLGRIIKKLSPQTESHPAGNLVELMLSMGNAMGRHTYFQIEDTRHYTNEFMVKVGESSKARKGTGKHRITHIMKMVDVDWVKNCNTGGIGSGEVVIHLIHDEMTKTQPDEDGNPELVVTASNIEDKRLTVSVGEFQGILAVCHKPDSLLSVILRDGWDGNPLRNTVKSDPAHVMEPQLTILADTTISDLSVSLSQADRNNGFANRFLWVYVYRTQLLPLGGEEIDWRVEVEQLKKVLEFGQMDRRITFDKPARDLWTRTIYPKVEEDVPGLVGSIISRAAAHILRLAMLYAIFDLSLHIQRPHLEAAYALWRYCEDSAKTIFGDLLSPEQQKILDHLAQGPATKKMLIEDCFKKNRKADLIQNDLNVLEAQRKVTDSTDKKGVIWWSKVR